MKIEQHMHGKDRASLRAKRLREHLENIEVELLKRARQNWEEWNHIRTGRWMDVVR